VATRARCHPGDASIVTRGNQSPWFESLRDLGRSRSQYHRRRQGMKGDARRDRVRFQVKQKGETGIPRTKPSSDRSEQRHKSLRKSLRRGVKFKKKTNDETV